MTRVLKGRPVRLAHTFLDGESVLPVTAPVTVTLNDLQGVAVASAEATSVGDAWTVSLPKQEMGVYTAVWDTPEATDETPVEVVANFLFSIPEARASDEYLADADAFPAEEIAAYREVVEVEFERITSRSFTTRVKDIEITSDGSRELFALVPNAQAIEGVWLNDVAVSDLTGWSVSGLGKVTTPSCATVAEDSVRVRVRYGYATPPADVVRVAMIRLRALLAAESTAIPDRATTWQPENGGTFRLATPGQGKWRTGIPEVDSTLANYALDVVLSVIGLV